jgi:putative nucleotidyltransferase with HDIG domain
MSAATAVMDWLRPLGAAVSARQLYRADHPRVTEAVAALQDASGRLLGGRESVSLFMVEDRLTCDGGVIAGAGPTATRMFRALSACGYDRLTISQGVTSVELEGLVSALSGAGRDADRESGVVLQSTPHLRLSVVDLDGRAAPPEASVARPVDVRQLLHLWRSIDETGAIDLDMLDGLIAPLVEIVSHHAGEVLPLSSLQTHDDYTATHITNVAVLTMALAEALNVPKTLVRQVGVAALLHDIGKMKVPASILNSRQRLAPDELVLMRRHPEVGARMLMGTPGIPPLAAIVAFEHHLQADGGGYPTVPHGWTINPVSAMTHVADVYDALRTNRPYRAALAHDEIVELMTRDRGTVFPAPLVDVFFDRVAR